MKTRPADSHHALKSRLEGRRQEISDAVLTRALAIDVPGQDADPEYLEGLREAIEAAIADTIEALKAGSASSPPVPAPLLTQARLAARRRIPLETMLRRYLAGHAILGDFVIEEAARQAIPADTLRWGLRSQAARTDQVLAAISACYLEEASAARPISSVWRRAEQVRRLLEGELADPSGLDYELTGWHIGLVARGPDRDDVVEAIAKRLDSRRLVVPAEDEAIWAWLGFKAKPERIELAETAELASGLRIGVGEPAEGNAGWRLTHEQARAALAVASRRPETALRYEDAALLAAATQDELLAASLHQLYLEPLEVDQENGRDLRITLRAYFEADRSVTSTAAALGVSRNTVASRIRTIEEKVGYLHSSRAAQLLVALGLAELTKPKANR